MAQLVTEFGGKNQDPTNIQASVVFKTTFNDSGATIKIYISYGTFSHENDSLHGTISILKTDSVKSINIQPATDLILNGFLFLTVNLIIFEGSLIRGNVVQVYLKKAIVASR